MNIADSTEVQCPYCGAVFAVFVDLVEGRQKIVEDCAVCCRPASVTVFVSGDGVMQVEVHGENE